MSTLKSDQEEDRKQSPSVDQEGPQLEETTQSNDGVVANADNGDSAQLGVETSAGSKSTKSTAKSCEIILTPGPDDILMGREWSAQNHPGNHKMRTLVEMHKESYWKRSLPEKGALVKELLRKLRKEGARFLKRRESTTDEPSPIGWEIASRIEAYDKVCHVLRDKRRFRPEQSRNAINPPSTTNNNPAVRESIRAERRHRSTAGLDSTRNFAARMSLVQQRHNLLARTDRYELTSSPLDSQRDWQGMASIRLPSDNDRRENSTPGRSAVVTSDSAQASSTSDQNTGGTAPDTSNSAQTSTSGQNSETSTEDDLDTILEGMDDVHPAIKMALISYLGQKRGT